MIPNVAAVVVHHRSYESVAEVIEKLLLQGLFPANIVVVDNSEEPDKRVALCESIPAEVVVVFEKNFGYGAAVNAGIDYFDARDENRPQFFLVSTHETRPEPGAVAALLKALEDDPEAAVAGPTLVSGSDSKFVWSTGGYLAPLTHIPSHYDHRAPLDILQHKQAVEPREWLDGAFLLYRWGDIRERRMPERFFLYMEETDLHLSLAKAGRKVLWVPQACVWQDSGGIPPFYLARNLRILFQAHENLGRQLWVVPLAVVRRVAADIIRRGDFTSLAPSFRGLVAKLPREENDRTAVASVEILNPLGAALRHYESEVESVLTERGSKAIITRIVEPSASGHSPIRWITSYLMCLLKARVSGRRSRFPLLILWPVLGYWDIFVLRIVGLSRVTLVMHDPSPLVRAVGYSSLAKKCASFLGGNVTILAHSAKALDIIQRDVPNISARVLPHPILEPKDLGMHRSGVKPLVRVVGQYKPDRDLAALVEISSALRDLAVLEVHGRGWPNIEGWQVVPGFVTEARLDELMAESSVVVIPYKNFFQSGIAIRALELGVPFVGPRASVLSEMLGDDSDLLVAEGGEGAWVASVRHAIDSGRADAASAGRRWRSHSLHAWDDWIRQTV